jgi:rhodanese-related sulfurtransferase
MTTDLKISIDELKKRMAAGEDITFIDTRNPQAWGQSDLIVPKAIRMPLDSLAKHLDELPKNKPIVAYCT